MKHRHTHLAAFFDTKLKMVVCRMQLCMVSIKRHHPATFVDIVISACKLLYEILRNC